PNGTPPRSAPSLVTVKVARKATKDMDRSAQFQSCVAAAVAHGMTPDTLESLMRLHPQGCAGKYLEGGDRLRFEIDRSWCKSSELRGPETPKPRIIHTEGARVNASGLCTMTFQPIAFVVPNYIAEGLSLFCGKPKAGKSWLALHAAMAVGSGT